MKFNIKDYVKGTSFSEKIFGLIKEADKKYSLDEKTLIVFPEDLGTFLVFLGEENIVNYDSIELAVKDFDNGADAFTEDGTPKDGEIFIIQRLMVGSKTIYDTEAKVVHGQGAAIIFGDDVMTEFSDYTIDEDNLELIFE